MRYPTRAEILVLHRAMLEQSGGTPGIRDLGARHAALAQRAAMETFLKVHGLRLSPPRGHQRLERHATRSVVISTSR